MQDIRYCIGDKQFSSATGAARYITENSELEYREFTASHEELFVNTVIRVAEIEPGDDDVISGMRVACWDMNELYTY